MKRLKVLIVASLLVALAGYAADLSAADQKWSDAVEKMITAGSAKISTPDENRAKLATQLAEKHGRESKVEKTEKGYTIVVQAPKDGQVAKNTE